MGWTNNLWAGVRRPEETRDWVCTVGHSGNSSGSPVLSLTWLATVMLVADLSDVCVLCGLFPWKSNARTVSVEPYKREFLQFQGYQRESWSQPLFEGHPVGEDGFKGMRSLDMEGLITCCHINRNRLGYFSPLKNRVILNVICWVTTGDREHMQNV